MKHIIIIIAILLAYPPVKAQIGDSIPSHRLDQIKKIQDLIKNDHVIELSELIQYPLKRHNPVPDINSKESFVLFYPILFDEDFKQKLLNTTYTTDNTIERYSYLGLFLGDIWLNNSGEIIAINHRSPKELTLQNAITNDVKANIYPDVNDWKENIIVCKSEGFLLRIDLLENNTLRYVSWRLPKTISDKPDLILFNGIQEFHGTMGGVSYTFADQSWKYIIDQVNICAEDEDCGLFLILLQNGKEISKTRLQELK